MKLKCPTCGEKARFLIMGVRSTTIALLADDCTIANGNFGGNNANGGWFGCTNNHEWDCDELNIDMDVYDEDHIIFRYKELLKKRKESGNEDA